MSSGTDVGKQVQSGRRAGAIRWVAFAVAVVGIAVIGVALVSRATFGVTRVEAIALGIGPVVLSVVVAVRARRIGDGPSLMRLVFAQVMVATVAASIAVGLSDDATISVMLAVVVALVYSGTILTERQHATVVVTAVGLSGISVVLSGSLTATTVTGLVMLALLGGLTGMGAHLHTAELHDRDEAADMAHRSTRALDAAVEGILHATSTEPDEIFDAVVGAAARLVEGPAVLYVLGEDGMAHPGASHGLTPGLDELPLPATSGLIGQLLQTDTLQTIHAQEAADHGRIHGLLGLETVVTAPIRANGLVVGVLIGGHAAAADWTDEERGAFALLAQHAGRALELSDQAAADRRMLARMAELDRMKDDVVATVSHELRTPVTVITGLAETLARRQSLDAELRDELVQRLWANGVALAQIVEQLLDAALLQRGELVPTLQPVHVARVVRGTATRLSPLMGAHTVDVDVADDLHVRADPMLLERVVDNVVVNALRHTPPGTSVRISATPRDGQVEIAVEDDGPGIAAADLERILQRFERAGGPDQPHRGMGIGLALASEILRVHGSAMEVTSGIGDGARFAFVLPSATTADEVPERRVSR